MSHADQRQGFLRWPNKLDCILADQLCCSLSIDPGNRSSLLRWKPRNYEWLRCNLCSHHRRDLPMCKYRAHQTPTVFLIDCFRSPRHSGPTRQRPSAYPPGAITSMPPSQTPRPSPNSVPTTHPRYSSCSVLTTSQTQQPKSTLSRRSCRAHGHGLQRTRWQVRDGMPLDPAKQALSSLVLTTKSSMEYITAAVGM